MTSARCASPSAWRCTTPRWRCGEASPDVPAALRAGPFRAAAAGTIVFALPLIGAAGLVFANLIEIETLDLAQGMAKGTNEETSETANIRLDAWSRAIDHCPKCGKDLARRRVGKTPSLVHLERRKLVDVDLFCSGVLGDFVAQVSTISEPPTICDVKGAVDGAINRGLAANRNAFAMKAGMSQSTLTGLCRAQRNASLVLLMRTAAVADVAMAGMFYPDLKVEGARGQAPAELGHAPRLRIVRRHDWDQIRAEIKMELDAGEIVSLHHLARRLNVDQSYLSEKIGGLRDELLQRARESRAAAKVIRVETLTALVQEARNTLAAQRARPSARAIGALLDRSPDSPQMRKAIALARLEPVGSAFNPAIDSM